MNVPDNTLASHKRQNTGLKCKPVGLNSLVPPRAGPSQIDDGPKFSRSIEALLITALTSTFISLAPVNTLHAECIREDGERRLEMHTLLLQRSNLPPIDQFLQAASAKNALRTQFPRS
jgi:hypothetical protein